MKIALSKSVWASASINDCVPDALPNDVRHQKAFWRLWSAVEARVAEWWAPRSFTTMLFAIVEDDADDAGIVDVVTHDDDAGGTGDAASPVKSLEDGEEEGVRH